MKCSLAFWVIIILISCSTERSVIKVATKKGDLPREDVVLVQDTFDYDNFFKLGNQTIEISMVSEIFNQLKDSISTSVIQKSLRQKYSFEDPLFKRLRIGKTEKAYDSRSFLRLFSLLAKSGDIETEKWALDFFDTYIEESLNWNNRSSDGPGGQNGLFHFGGPLSGNVLNSLFYLPPSNKKIDLLMKIYGLEKTMMEDDQIFAGPDSRILGNILMGVEFFKGREYYLMLYSNFEVSEIERMRKVRELISKIQAGEIKYLSRDSWKIK